MFGRKSGWLCWVLIAGVCAGLTRAEDSVLPKTFLLSEVKDLENWGPAVQDGAAHYRAALGGKAARVCLPNWWNGTVRPPKGKIFIVEVSYKDTLSEPARAYAFSGLGLSAGPSELHRFGGANDGQWKVAQLPVSWDMIMLPQGKTTAEFIFRAPAGLPVSQLTVREAKLPEDQVRWEAESRAWIARAQAGKTAKLAPSKASEAVIPAAFQGKRFVPYVRPYYEPVQQSSAPKAGEAGGVIHLRMARNEFEPGSFGVYALEDIEGVTYTLSELTGPAGKLACEVKLMTAEYAFANVQDGIVPQRFWPAFPAKIAKGQSCWFYFTLRTLGEASAPGVYSGKVTVSAGGQQAELPVKAEVLPLTLKTMDEAVLLMGGCCAGSPSASEMRTMAEHNHNMVNLWIAGVCPGMKKNGNTVDLDFYYLDDWMKLAKENGQHAIVWFLGGNPNGYPETLSIERDLYRTLYGSQEDYYKKMSSAEGRGKLLPEIVPAYKKFMQDLVAHAQKNDWPELIFTPFDEPAKWCHAEPKPEQRQYAIGCGPWIRSHFKAACALIHEAVPGTKVYASIHHNYVREVHGYNGRVGEIFIPDVDVFSTNAIHEDKELGDKVRKAGKNFWQYSGLGYGNGRYNLGFYFNVYNSRGSLCWAYNWGARFDTSSGANWEYGWMSPFETLVTSEYELYREGWDDRRYVETAKAAAKAKGADISALLNTIRTETIEDRIADDFWGAGRSASKMDQWRKMLADKIIELSK